MRWLVSFPSPAEERRVGSSPGRFLNMRGMFNPMLAQVRAADWLNAASDNHNLPNWALAFAGEEEEVK